MAIKNADVSIKNDDEVLSEEPLQEDESKQKEQKKEEFDEDRVILLDPYGLKPHPKNVEIYGNDDPDDIEILAASIIEMGQLEPIVIGRKRGTTHKILSGHRRWKAICEIKKNAKTEEEAQKVKIRCIYKPIDSELREKEALIEYNRQRKKNYEQIYHEVKLLEEIYAEQAKLRMKMGKPLDPESDLTQGMGTPGRTIEKQAEATGISPTQLKKLIEIGDRCAKSKKKENQKLYENAITVMKELRVGELSLDGADKKLEILDSQYDEKLPDWKRAKLADLVREVKAQKITPNKASEKLKKIKTASDVPEKETKIELPEGVFDVLVADPPNIDEARELKIDAINAACFLWANKQNITERIELMKHWGFDLKEIAVWKNTKSVGGPWFFGAIEFLLFGVKGSMTPPDKKQQNHVIYDTCTSTEPVNEAKLFCIIFKEETYNTQHKGGTAYDIAEQMFPGRTYCDPFSRNGREKWLQPNIVEVEEE